MKAATNGVKVSIMGREFSVVCEDEQQEALSQAAVHLDRTMRDIQKGGKVIGIERCAIMAALNITHELLDLRKRSGEAGDIGGRLRDLQDKIDAVMQDQHQLSL